MSGFEPGEKVRNAPYFFGRITRDESEDLLSHFGNHDGMFLLRESITPVGNFVLSICFDNKPKHYNIIKQTDGSYQIPDGKKFSDPIDLIDYHKKTKDGLLTRLTQPCNQSYPFRFLKYHYVTYDELEEKLSRKVESLNLKGREKDAALTRNRAHLIGLVTKDLHKEQEWFHGEIKREVAEQRVMADGRENGIFLIREKKNNQGYALTLCFNRSPKHYKVDKDLANRFSINNGPQFDNLMLLVDNYYNKQDGLLCKLHKSATKPNSGKKYNDLRSIFMKKFGSLSSKKSYSSKKCDSVDSSQTDIQTWWKRNARPTLKPRRNIPLPPLPDAVSGNLDNPVEEEMTEAAQNLAEHSESVFLDKNSDDIYGSVKLKFQEKFILDKSQIVLEDSTLGTGNFGSVKLGTCKLANEDIPVAVKTLKKEDLPTDQEPEILQEARIMQDLDHKNLVRIIGVCQAESLMLVIELAPLGPLNKFVQRNRNIPVWNILEIMSQVAQGMHYLEDKQFVHRDLAARNVLLVNQHFAKVSDFGMSKACGAFSDYYKARSAGKWPLKWYAPECLYYFKFTSKSDVWSFGVTMWEAFSNGDKPYRKIRCEELLKMIHNGERLQCPASCDEEIYDIMLHCWAWEEKERISFGELVPILKDMKKVHENAMASVTYG